MRYRYFLSLLDEREQQMYRYIFSKISECSRYIDVSATIPTIQRVLKAILLDTPEFFWFQGKWRAESLNDHIRIIPKYSIEGYQRELAYSNIQQIVSRIASRRNGSKIGVIRNVYDKLLDNVRYGQARNDQTVEGAFIDAVAVCKGISKAFQMCMNSLDIPCILIEGTLDEHESHVWNIVFVDGEAYHVDVTMGYSRFSKLFSSDSRILRYPCFMVSDETIKRTHRIYPNNLPICNKDIDTEAELVKEARIPPRFYEYGRVCYLDRGSTCSVFKVEGDKEQFALKVLPPYAFDVAKKEMMVLKRLSDCEHIVPLVDSDLNETDGFVYLLFPFMKSLSKRCRAQDFDIYHDTQKLGIDILLALIECKNKGIYHLDIQPKNIYYDDKGKAMLSDFGNSAFESELNALNQRRGTLAFMAPEVYLYGKYSEASEIYSLGIIMYSLLNKAKLPFTDSMDYGEALQLRFNGRAVPVPCSGMGALWDCIQKMCEYDVAKRICSYSEALNKLSNL